MKRVRISKTDDLQYVVEIRDKSDGWKPDGYYRTLSGACKGALDVSGPSGQDIVELKKSVNECLRDLLENLKELQRKGQLTLTL